MANEEKAEKISRLEQAKEIREFVEEGIIKDMKKDK